MSKHLVQAIHLKDSRGVLVELKETKRLIPVTGRVDNSPTFHLHFTSAESIVADDWFVYRQYFVKRCLKISGNLLESLGGAKDHFEGVRKIIATTDPTLGLPLIAPSFVEEYITLQGNLSDFPLEWDSQEERVYYRDEAYYEDNVFYQTHGVLQDTTERLLSGGNRERILSSLQRYNNTDTITLTSDYAELRAKLKECRLAAGLTQQELGKLLGTQRAWVNKLENQRVNMTWDTVYRVFAALGCRVTLQFEAL